jgi:hypothetical protein
VRPVEIGVDGILQQSRVRKLAPLLDEGTKDTDHLFPLANGIGHLLTLHEPEPVPTWAAGVHTEVPAATQKARRKFVPACTHFVLKPRCEVGAQTGSDLCDSAARGTGT